MIFFLIIIMNITVLLLVSSLFLFLGRSFHVKKTGKPSKFIPFFRIDLILMLKIDMRV